MVSITANDTVDLQHYLQDGGKHKHCGRIITGRICESMEECKQV